MQNETVIVAAMQELSSFWCLCVCTLCALLQRKCLHACEHTGGYCWIAHLKAGRSLWHSDETLHPSSQTKQKGWGGSQQDETAAKVAASQGKWKEFSVLPNYCKPFGCGLAHGAATVVFKVPNVWLEVCVYVCLVLVSLFCFDATKTVRVGIYLYFTNLISLCLFMLTFSGPGSAQIQIVSGYILGVQVRGWHPALLLHCADKPPACRERHR